MIRFRLMGPESLVNLVGGGIGQSLFGGNLFGNK